MEPIIFEEKIGRKLPEAAGMDVVDSLIEEKYGKLGPVRRVERGTGILSSKRDVFRTRTYGLEERINEEIR